MSVGSDSDLNENEKDPYQQSVQENEIDICKEILQDVDNILNEFPDVPEFNFPADTWHLDFDPNPINQSIFPADTSLQLDLNPNPINRSIFLAGISVQPDLNPNPINQGPADVSNDSSIGTLSNNLPLRELTNVLENGPKKKAKRSCSKRCIINFSSDDRALINSRFWKLSFTERRHCLAAYINEADVKNKTSQQKSGGRQSFREYLVPLKDGRNVIFCKSMFLSTLGLKLYGMITEMVHAQRQSYDGAMAPVEDCRGSHLPSNKCDQKLFACT